MTLTVLPAPRPVGDVPSLRWGILGTGWIAGKFCEALARNTSQRVAAVGSRSRPSAEAFAGAHGIDVAGAYGSYVELVADPSVDVVYVATPHHLHLEHALLALEAGKHVLVEKPLCLNAAQVRELTAAASRAGLFAMEALWTLFLPKYDVIRQLLAAGDLGEIRSVQADIGEWFEDSHRIFDPALAGGCMMDMATYPVTFATWVAGAPEVVRAVGLRGPSGVIGRTAMSLRTASIECVLEASIDAALPTRAAISGTDALVELDGPFYQPGPFSLRLRSGSVLRYDEPALAHEGLYHQALHVAKAIGEGRTSCEWRTLADSELLLATMDRVRTLTGDALVTE